MLETDYPFSSSAPQICQSEEKSPTDIIKISGDSYIHVKDSNYVKRKLITHGPLIASLNADTPNASIDSHFGHSMLLIGFGQIYAGMDYYDFPNSGYLPLQYTHAIADDDPRIGATYWIFKNSWGVDHGDNGYFNVIFNEDTHVYQLYSLAYPVLSECLAENDRLYVDNDGDGYYFWGGDNPPSSLPSWAPIYKDADDTDPTVGRLLDSGVQMEDIVPDHYSTMNLSGSYNASGAFHFQYVHHHTALQSGAVLQIDNRVNFYNGATLKVCNGATLIVKEGGMLHHVILDMESGSKIRIEGGGQIILAEGHSFSPPVGAEVEIINGSIEPYY